MRLPWFSLALISAICAGQGTEPKPKAADYPGHATVGKISIGAENWGHGIATRWGSYAADDYIVIEVALYSEGNVPFAVSNGHFTLRLNRKGVPLLPQATGFVAASIKYPDWERRPELVTTAGMGDAGVILGRRRPVERFPGDPQRRDRTPPPPRAPAPQDPDGMEREKTPPLNEILERSAIVEGEAHPPVSGYLFFPYKGKLKSLKTVELLYEGPAGSASVVVP